MAIHFKASTAFFAMCLCDLPVVSRPMKDIVDHPQVALRAPEKVMRLRRMGAAFPTRLSFLRTLMRALAADNVKVTRPVWEMSADGYGHAV